MNEPTREAVLVALGSRENSQGHRIFSDEARVLAMSYVRARMSEGQEAGEVAMELKLKRGTLRRWLQRERRGGEKKLFAQLEVKASEGVECCVVQAGYGVRVEGLSLTGVARLLKELSCLG